MQHEKLPSKAVALLAGDGLTEEAKRKAAALRLQARQRGKVSRRQLIQADQPTKSDQVNLAMSGPMPRLLSNKCVDATNPGAGSCGGVEQMVKQSSSESDVDLASRSTRSGRGLSRVQKISRRLRPNFSRARNFWIPSFTRRSRSVDAVKVRGGAASDLAASISSEPLFIEMSMRAEVAEARADAAEARLAALERGMPQSSTSFMLNEMTREPSMEEDSSVLGSSHQREHAHLRSKLHSYEGRFREVEASLLAANALAEERARQLARLDAGDEGGTSGGGARNSNRNGMPGAKVQRQFLRSLDEIIGPANPSCWVDEFRDLLLMQDASMLHSKVTPEHTMHLTKTSAELLHHYRHEYGGGYYDRQIQGMVDAGWDEEHAAPVRMLPAFGGAAMSNTLTHNDRTLAASCHAVARGIALRAKSV